LDVELVVADKLYQVAAATRHGQRAYFQKFDVAKVGSLAPAEFKAAIASLGITLSDREITLLLQKVTFISMHTKVELAVDKDVCGDVHVIE
jgi:hypothetical protein